MAAAPSSSGNISHAEYWVMNFNAIQFSLTLKKDQIWKIRKNNPKRVCISGNELRAHFFKHLVIIVYPLSVMRCITRAIVLRSEFFKLFFTDLLHH